MKDIEMRLKEKFKEDELEFRVGATNADKTMGLALAYVSARAIQNRLDNVVGINNWKTSYREVVGGFICSLSIRLNNEWITKEDGANSTDFETVKGGISNAFKRVASSGFGIGRYLYQLENKWYPIKQVGKSYTFIEQPKIDLSKQNQKSVEFKNMSLGIILSFGKYKGKTIQEVFERDRRYVQYLRENAKDPNILRECNKLLRIRA